MDMDKDMEKDMDMDMELGYFCQLLIWHNIPFALYVCGT
jgi:hypothetical protein